MAELSTTLGNVHSIKKQIYCFVESHYMTNIYRDFYVFN